MGKAAHVGVGRLFSLDNLDGVHGHGMNNARGEYADGTGKKVAGGAEETHPTL
mgnify:CR=1 FL=1